MLAVAMIAAVICASAVWAVNVPRYGVFELTLTASGSYSNPYLKMPGDNTTPGFVVGTFTGPGGVTIQIDGFWDGGSTWRIRMAPTVVGTWTYTTSSSDLGLNAKTGSFNCVASTSKGFPQVDPNHRHHFCWTDGTPFYWAPVATMIAYFDDYDTRGDNRRVDNGTFQALADTRSAQGFSGTHWGFWGLGKKFNQKTRQNEGGPPFLNYDPDLLNPAYHQYGDIRMMAFVERGSLRRSAWERRTRESNRTLATRG